MIDNETISTVLSVVTQGLDLAMTPPIVYGVVIGLVMMGISIVGAWFRFKKKRA